MNSDKNLSVETFSLIFIAIIWRRVWIVCSLYCEHNKCRISKDILLKILKYNIFSEAGMLDNIKQYIETALTDGFMMPKFYQENVYATRAVKMFKTVYKIVDKNNHQNNKNNKNNKNHQNNKNNREIEDEFITNYALSIFDNDQIKEVIAETNDAMNIFWSDDNNSNCITGGYCLNIKEGCKCEICKLIDSWDINSSLLYSDDIFQNRTMVRLMAILDVVNI